MYLVLVTIACLAYEMAKCNSKNLLSTFPHAGCWDLHVSDRWWTSHWCDKGRKHCSSD